MPVPAPHFLLHSRANRAEASGHWSFTLRSADGSDSLAIADAEPETHGERLELLAVVRGLEAVPQPARVTLITSSSYVNRVLSGGLDEWRSSGWRWERHGEMVPVKNADLWRRVDRAMSVHEVHCRSLRGSSGPIADLPSSRAGCVLPPTPRRRRHSDSDCFTARGDACRPPAERANGTRLTGPKPLPHKVLFAGMLFARRLWKRWDRIRKAFVQLGNDWDAYA